MPLSVVPIHTTPPPPPRPPPLVVATHLVSVCAPRNPVALGGKKGKARSFIIIISLAACMIVVRHGRLQVLGRRIDNNNNNNATRINQKQILGEEDENAKA